jgi:hypothetical protein
MTTGGTLTLPACTVGQLLYVYNGSTSTTLTVTGANSFSATQLPPTSGALYENENGANWYSLSSYNLPVLVNKLGLGTPSAGKYLDGGGTWTTLPAASIQPSVRAGTATISAATTATVTFATAMSVAPTSCTLNPSASSATTGQPFATAFTTTGFTANVPTSGTLAMTYQCVVNNAN